MAETSYFWDGLVTGDAIQAPYSHNLWHKLWQIMFSRTDNEGVLNNVDGELVVSGVAGGVSVATGKALVDGTLYETDAAISVTIPTPVTDPRIDRIVVRKDWSTQTIRVARVAGTENASPTAPALTQTDLSVWEIPLAQVLITTAGVITITKERENARTRLGLANVGLTAIETFTATGVEADVDFRGIPTTFQHLIMRGSILSSVAGAGAGTIRINGDSNIANYNRIVWGRSTGAVAASSGAGTLLPRIDTMGSAAASRERSTPFDLRIPNYKDTTFYKTVIQKEGPNRDNTTNSMNITQEEFLWLNTDAVNRITIVPDAGVLEVGTVITLFGMG